MNDYANDNNPANMNETRTEAPVAAASAEEYTRPTEAAASRQKAYAQAQQTKEPQPQQTHTQPRQTVNPENGSYTYYYNYTNGNTNGNGAGAPPPIPPTASAGTAESRPPRRKRSKLGIWLAAGLVTAGLLGFLGGRIARSFVRNDVVASVATAAPVLDNGDAVSTGFVADEDPTPVPAATLPPTVEETLPPVATLPPETVSGEVLTAKEIAAMNLDSVVEIQTQIVTSSYWGGSSVTPAAGSGIIVTADGYIVTNHHVIEDAASIAVRLNNKETYEARLVGSDPQSDLAVLKIDAAGLDPVAYGSSAALVPGDYVVAIGNPLGTLGGTVTDGIISAVSREIIVDGVTRELLQTNAAINPGNSGGALFNDRGELIGVVEAKSVGTELEGLGYAIPVDIAKPVIEELISQGYVSGRIHPGFTFLDITSEQMAYLYRVGRVGVYVYDLEDGSDAEKAGFRVTDCITAVDGKSVTTGEEVGTILNSHKPGDTLVFSVVRGSQSGTITMTLTEYRYTAPSGGYKTENPFG